MHPQTSLTNHHTGNGPSAGDRLDDDVQAAGLDQAHHQQRHFKPPDLAANPTEPRNYRQTQPIGYKRLQLGLTQAGIDNLDAFFAKCTVPGKVN